MPEKQKTPNNFDIVRSREVAGTGLEPVTFGL